MEEAESNKEPTAISVMVKCEPDVSDIMKWDTFGRDSEPSDQSVENHIDQKLDSLLMTHQNPPEMPVYEDGGSQGVEGEDLEKESNANTQPSLLEDVKPGPSVVDSESNSCEMCFKVMEMNRLLKKMAPEDQDPYDCRACGRKFTWEELLGEGGAGRISAAEATTPVASGSKSGLEAVGDTKEEDVLKCGSCQLCFNDDSELQDHILSDECSLNTMRSSLCKVCGARFARRTALNAHMKSVHNKKAQPVAGTSSAAGKRGKRFACDFCGKKYLSTRARDAHVAEMHDEASGLGYDEDDEEFVPNFGVKKEDMDDVDSLANMLEMDDELGEYSGGLDPETGFERGGSLQCELCEATYSSKAALKKHMKVHGTLKPFQCLCCVMTFSTEENLNRHMEVVHENSTTKALEDNFKTFQCDICKLRYYEKNGLVRHIKRVHENAQPESVECKFCSAKFFDKKLLTKHIHALHETTKPFACDLCDMSFHKSRYLSKHKVMIHNIVRTYPCKFCKDVFTSRTEVRIHLLKAHENTAKNQCDLCHKQLSCRAALWAHINQVHEKVLRYQCETCGKNFATKEQMKRHKQYVHDKIRPYQCHLCGKSFQNKFFLKSHIQNHNKDPNEVKKDRPPTVSKLKGIPQGPRDKTKAKPFECQFCQIKFTINSNLRRHVRRLHPNVNLEWMSKMNSQT